MVFLIQSLSILGLFFKKNLVNENSLNVFFLELTTSFQLSHTAHSCTLEKKSIAAFNPFLLTVSELNFIKPISWKIDRQKVL